MVKTGDTVCCQIRNVHLHTQWQRQSVVHLPNRNMDAQGDQGQDQVCNKTPKFSCLHIAVCLQANQGCKCPLDKWSSGQYSLCSCQSDSANQPVTYRHSWPIPICDKLSRCIVPFEMSQSSQDICMGLAATPRDLPSLWSTSPLHAGEDGYTKGSPRSLGCLHLSC